MIVSVVVFSQVKTLVQHNWLEEIGICATFHFYLYLLMDGLLQYSVLASEKEYHYCQTQFD